MRQSISKRFSHNIYIVSIYRALRNLAQTEQSEQTEQNTQNRLLEIAGDVVGAISLFLIFYMAFFVAGIYQ